MATVVEEAEKPAFACVPKLPLELRRLVWEKVLPEPRIVMIRQSHLRKTIGEWEEGYKSEWPLQAVEQSRAVSGATKVASGVNDLGGDAGEDHTHTDAKDISITDDQGEDDEEEVIWDTAGIIRQAARAEITRAIGGYAFNKTAYKKAPLLRIKSYTPPPHITHVCRESMEVVSKFYPKILATAYSSPRTYFNFELDTLYLRHNTFSRYSAEEGISAISDSLHTEFGITDVDNLAKIENLAISTDPNLDDHPESNLSAILNIFHSLEELTLVVKHFKGRDKETNDQSQLAFAELYDVHKAIEAYEDYSMGDEFDFETGRLPPDSPPNFDVPTLDYRCLDLDPAELKKYQRFDYEDYGIHWNIPPIDYQVIVPLGLKKRLDEARRNS